MCEYRSYYYDPESNTYEPFTCLVPPLKGKFCEFHDPTILTHSPDEEAVRSAFLRRLDETNEEPKLLFVGYHLPTLHLEDRTFNRNVVFDKATFHGFTGFSYSKFNKKSSFQGATFKENASFFKSTFSEKISFEGCTFEKVAFFEEAKFNGVDFSRTQFFGETIFDLSDFRHITDYTFCKIFDEARFFNSHFTGTVNFTNVFIKNLENVIFKPQDGDMSSVSFANTDISRIRFSEDIRFGSSKNDKFKIQDEILLEQDIRRFKRSESLYVPLGAVLGVYRNLRENFEFRMRYDEAGELFIKEMEVKRRYTERWDDEEKKNIITLKNPIVRHLSLTAWYYYLSKYGQSP